MSVVPVICDQCGAALKASDDSDFTTCEYCRTTFRIKETSNPQSTYDEVRRQLSALDGAMTMFDESFKSANTGSSSGTSTFEIAHGVLTKFSGTAAKVVIPRGVVEIDNKVFSGISTITSIVIPDTVESIGKPGMLTEGVFENCVNLKRINIPNNVTYISPRAFFGCRSLAQVDISPEKLGQFGYESVKALFDYENFPAQSSLLAKLGLQTDMPFSAQSPQQLNAQTNTLTGTPAQMSEQKEKASIERRLWIFVAILVVGVIFVGVIASSPPNSIPSTSTEIATKTLGLDASYTDNELTVYYPSSWNRQPGDSANTTLIFSPDGGLVQVGRALGSSAVSANSTRAEANEAFSSFYEGIESSGETKLDGTPKRIIKAGTLVEIVAVRVSIDTIEYKGYLYTGYNGTHLASVMAAVPVDASRQDYLDIKRIVDAVEYRSE